MKKIKIGIILLLIAGFLVSCSSPLPGSGGSGGGSTEQIIADHNVVDEYQRIPDQWIDAVKQMFFSIPGASHGRGLVYGLDLLEQQDSRFAANITWSGAPEGPTSSHLRAIRTYRNEANSSWAITGGEETFWTNSPAVDMMKNHLDYCRDTLDNPVDIMSYAWSYEVADGTLAGGWAGTIFTAINQSSQVDSWDLDSTAVNMDDYIAAIEAYNSYNPDTVTFFATAPLDGGSSFDERGYQRWLKNEYIRDYVGRNSNAVLFDYADILSYNQTGEQNTDEWNGYVFPRIHLDNDLDNDGDSDDNYDGGDGGCHIGEAGCLRLGKALWWMLARIAGWDGN